MFPCFVLGNTSTRLIYVHLARSVDIIELVLAFVTTKWRNVYYIQILKVETVQNEAISK